MERRRELRRLQRASLSLKNKEQERENKIEKDKEGGGLSQLLLAEREKD